MHIADTAQLAGFFTAHAVWSVCEGETLIPMLVYPGADGRPAMARLVSEDSRVAVADAQQRLPREAEKHGAAILLYDTFVTLGEWRTDAIMIEALSESGRLVMTVPYRAAQSDLGFAVYRPKFVECPEEKYQILAERFFQGVDGHQKGNEVWAQFIDQSR